MRIIETELFIMQIPADWEAEQEDETIIIEDPDGVSTIEITSLQKDEGLVSEADLKEFASELIAEGGIPASAVLGGFNGIEFEYVDDDGAWREWFVAAKNSVLLISHGTEVDHQGIDDAIIDEILETLVYAPDVKVDESKGE